MIVIGVVILVAGGAAAFYLLGSDDRACEEFHDAVMEEYFPGEPLDADFRDQLIQAIYNEGRFTNREGEVITKPEGCEPP